MSVEDTVKILVVEDNRDKLLKVVRCLSQVPGCDPELIHTAQDAMEAKRAMRAEQYDLLVLDVALPERAGGLPSPDGGIGLLQEILDRPVYYTPREVVGLTAFPEVRDAAGPRFAEDLWMVVQYDPGSDAWADQLQRKVRHILLARRSGGGLAHNVELCVVTALVKPELEAVQKIPWHWSRLEAPNDSAVFYEGEFLKAGSIRKVVAAAAPRVGMTAASVLATKMIFHFRPRYLAMVGIAAGIRGECELGDIIAADPGWDWGSGKQQTEASTSVFAAAPHQIGLNSFIRGKLSAMADDSDVFASIRTQWPGPKPNTILQMHIGPMASGAAVLADKAAISMIKQQHRKIIGIEMESYGVLAAADEAPLPQPKAFILKSVCDFADEEKGDDFQAYAAYTSASSLQVFVERFL
jgi:nucleoside phosphorylase